MVIATVGVVILVVKVGLSLNTAFNVPVSSVKDPDKFAEVKEPRAVELPVETTAPVKFALVVTLPAVKPVAVPVILVPTKVEGVPKFGVTNVGEVFITNVVPVPVCNATLVVLPTLVMGPIRFALVVTVAALPVTLPAIGAVTVNPVKVPTEVIAGCAAAVTVPAVVALEAVAADPVTLPAIGAVTVNPDKVPTEVIAG